MTGIPTQEILPENLLPIRPFSTPRYLHRLDRAFWYALRSKQPLYGSLCLYVLYRRFFSAPGPLGFPSPEDKPPFHTWIVFEGAPCIVVTYVLFSLAVLKLRRRKYYRLAVVFVVLMELLRWSALCLGIWVAEFAGGVWEGIGGYLDRPCTVLWMAIRSIGGWCPRVGRREEIADRSESGSAACGT